MTIIHPADTEIVPNGVSDPPNIYIEFTLNTGDQVRFANTGSDPIFFGRSTTFNHILYRSDNNTVVHGGQVPWGGSRTFTYVATEPMGVYLSLFIGGAGSNDRPGEARAVTVETTANTDGPCVHGTQRKFGIPGVITLTPDEILNLLSFRGWDWMQNALAFLNFANLNVEDLCSHPPPPLPVIDVSTLTAGIETWTKIFHSVIWSRLCECVPGTPVPIPYPDPTGTKPTDWPPPLVFGCTNADVCATLIAIQRALAALLQTTGTTLELTTLLQRYGLPFASIRGARHSGLTGTAAFAVPRCLGFLVEVTSWPADNQVYSGVPAYVSDLGWISILDGNGFIEQVRLTRQAYNWFPRSAQEATSFGYALREGVVADVTELYAEP